MHTVRTPSLVDVSTEVLVTELLTRYNEAIFVGVDPQMDIKVNGSTPLASPPVVDLHSKLDKTTGLGSTLVGILSRLLVGLQSKTAQHALSSSSGN